MRNHISSLPWVVLFQDARKMADFTRCNATYPLAIVGVWTVMAQKCLEHEQEEDLTALSQVNYVASLDFNFIIFAAVKYRWAYRVPRINVLISQNVFIRYSIKRQQLSFY